MILYHVTLKELEIGKTYIADQVTHYFEKKREQNQEWVDLILNENKPEGAPDRQFTFFACDSVDNCYAFFSAQHHDKINEFNYYKVEMESPFKCVMCLTSVILNSGKDYQGHQEFIAEYWNPSKEWKYYEYLSKEMTIIEKVSEPNLEAIITAKVPYFADIKRCEKLYGF